MMIFPNHFFDCTNGSSVDRFVIVSEGLLNVQIVMSIRGALTGGVFVLQDPT